MDCYLFTHSNFSLLIFVEYPFRNLVFVYCLISIIFSQDSDNTYSAGELLDVLDVHRLRIYFKPLAAVVVFGSVFKWLVQQAC